MDLFLTYLASLGGLMVIYYSLAWVIGISFLLWDRATGINDKNAKFESLVKAFKRASLFGHVKDAFISLLLVASLSSIHNTLLADVTSFWTSLALIVSVLIIFAMEGNNNYIKRKNESTTISILERCPAEFDTRKKEVYAYLVRCRTTRVLQVFLFPSLYLATVLGELSVVMTLGKPGVLFWIWSVNFGLIRVGFILAGTALIFLLLKFIPVVIMLIQDWGSTKSESESKWDSGATSFKPNATFGKLAGYSMPTLDPVKENEVFPGGVTITDALPASLQKKEHPILESTVIIAPSGNENCDKTDLVSQNEELPYLSCSGALSATMKIEMVEDLHIVDPESSLYFMHRGEIARLSLYSGPFSLVVGRVPAKKDEIPEINVLESKLGCPVAVLLFNIPILSSLRGSRASGHFLLCFGETNHILGFRQIEIEDLGSSNGTRISEVAENDTLRVLGTWDSNGSTMDLDLERGQPDSSARIALLTPKKKRTLIPPVIITAAHHVSFLLRKDEVHAAFSKAG